MSTYRREHESILKKRFNRAAKTCKQKKRTQFTVVLLDYKTSQLLINLLSNSLSKRSKADSHSRIQSEIYNSSLNFVTFEKHTKIWIALSS